MEGVSCYPCGPASNSGRAMFGIRKEQKPVGRLLVDDGSITEQDLSEALALQEESGSKIGEVLIGEGKLKSYDFYKILAKHLNLQFVDLEKEPSDSILLEEGDRHNYVKMNAVPWKKEGKEIIIATTNITDDLKAWAEEKYGKHSFVITSSFDVRMTIQKNFSKQDDEEARELLWNQDPILSAKDIFLTHTGRNLAIAGIVLAFSLLVFDNLLSGIFIFINAFYLFTLLSKIVFFGVGMISETDRKVDREKEVEVLGGEKELPIYTLLIPLYKEKKRTISNLVNSVRHIDYPKSKLDVKMIVEEDDEQTIEIIKSLKCESYFEMIKVPFSLPRTKPKACNYALKFAKGEYVTIYDAEDRPDPLQLKKALAKFKTSDDDVVCVQARLNYYNRNENLLTRLFSMEYSSWFNFMLPGLELLKIPVPLGGTSNHFPIKILRGLNAWDPYNVTEDADLGLRIAQKGYKTAIIDSTTLEEAPIHLHSWLGQRSRWIKGYMQTYIVHMRKPVQLYKKLGFKGFMGFLFFVGAPSLVFLTMPFVALFSLVAYMSDVIFPEWFFAISLLNFVFGVMSHIFFSVIVIAKHKWWDMLPFSIAFPFYWILHIIACFKAVSQLITRPHYWYRTEHGVSKEIVENPISKKSEQKYANPA